MHLTKANRAHPYSSFCFLSKKREQLYCCFKFSLQGTAEVRHAIVLAPICTFLSLYICATPAFAEVKASLSADVLHDSNIFRVSDQLSQAEGIKRDDTLMTIQGEANASVNAGQTAIALDARIGHAWYVTNDKLKNFNYDADLAITKTNESFLTYDLHARAEQRLTPFEDLGIPVRNLQRVQHFFGRTTLAITPEFRAVVFPEYLRSTNANAAFRGNDFRQYGAGLGVGYFSPLGNSISFSIARSYTKGLHDRLVSEGGVTINAPIDFRDTSYDVRIEYSPSVLTKIDAVLSYVDRNNKSVGGRNYSGPAGSVSVTYHPHDRLQAVATVGRRLDSQSYIYVETIRNDYASLGATLALSENMRLGANADYYHRKFTGSPLVPGNPTSLRDSTYRFSAFLEQRLFDRLRLKVTGQHERRHADDPLFSYTSTSIRLSAVVAFGAMDR